MAKEAQRSRERTVLFLSMPALWPHWPYLPVVRRTRDSQDLGVVFDSRAAGLTGYSTTVFFANLLMLPPTLAQFLALPKEVFDGADELVAAGWCVD